MENSWKLPIRIGYILGVYKDNGEENGNCHLGVRVQGLGFEV